jgi:hypothetical protein
MQSGFYSAQWNRKLARYQGVIIINPTRLAAWLIGLGLIVLSWIMLGQLSAKKQWNY